MSVTFTLPSPAEEEGHGSEDSRGAAIWAVRSRRDRRRAAGDLVAQPAVPVGFLHVVLSLT